MAVNVKLNFTFWQILLLNYLPGSVKLVGFIPFWAV
jgi:hypothetical protein